MIIKNEDNPVPERLEKDLQFLGEVYPDLPVESVQPEGRFGPRTIDQLSREGKIPKKFMFIGSPGDPFPYRLEHSGGVRLII